MLISNFKSAKIKHFYLFVIILSTINLLALKNGILGVTSGLLWLIITGKYIASYIYDTKNIYCQTILGLFITLICSIILLTLNFYLFKINNFLIVLTFFIISLAALIANRQQNNNFIICNINLFKNYFYEQRQKNSKRIISIKNIFTALYFINYLILLIILFGNRTEKALLSPWDVLPKNFFILYFTLNLILLLIIFTRDKNNIDHDHYPPLLAFVSFHALLTFSIVPIIYKTGFGFDPFVHRAAEESLSRLGYLEPKPLYYIGQYTLIVFLSKILFIKISLLDKILVPLLASILLPPIAYFSLKKIFLNNKLILLTIIFIFSFLYFDFFYTAPQNLANLFLIILILLTLPNLTNNQKISFWPWLIALTIAFIHPLTGIPAIFYLGLITLKNLTSKKILYLSYLFIASISIPFFFILISFLTTDFKIQYSFFNIFNISDILNLPTYLPYHSVYHLIYLYKFNLLPLFIIAMIVGLFYWRKNHREPQYLISVFFFLASLLINFFLLGFIKFDSIIDYEQNEYAKRLLRIIFFFSLPILFSGIYFIASKILILKKGVLILTGAGALILTINLYLAYPRVDAFEKNRGYSVSSSDIKAVHWIDDNAGDKKYLVLANQSVSAAALQEFGFKKYYRQPSTNNYQLSIKNKTENIFYYPIPTSSPLYDLYLKMVYDAPKLEYIDQAKEMTGAPTVYFVINDYWLDAQKIISQATDIADETQNIDNRIWIFKYSNLN